MWIQRPLILVALAVAGLGALPLAADSCGGSALNTLGVIPGLTTYSNTGAFCQDNNEQVFTFTLDTTDFLNLYTLSYSTGGFSPILTLFDSAGSQIAVDHGGVYSVDPSLNSCGPRGIGTADNESTCLDAYISALLPSGDYTLVLTEAGNCASCGNFSTGDYAGFPDTAYSQFHHPDFTGFEWFGTGSTANFLSPNNGDQLTGNWSVQIVDLSPEPGTWLMGMSGVLIILFTLRRRRASTQG